MRRVDVVVLGRPVVRVDGQEIQLTGRQLLLALRLAHAGRAPVARRALLELWPDDSGTDGALRVALTRLRASMGADVVGRVGHGYLIDPTADLDADAFARLVRRTNDPDITATDQLQLLDQALALWSDDAYAGIEGTAWVDHEVVRLTELREQSIDRRFELLIAGAEDDFESSTVSELVDAAARSPEREHRCALAATALYRAGRQADALAVTARTRTVLLEKYGLDPGEELRMLELAILRHDVAGGRRIMTDEQRGQITSRLHAATGLLAAGADDALPIAREAVQLAREHGDRDSLPRTLLVTAQAMVLTGEGDPAPLVDEAQRIARTHSNGELLASAALVKFGRGVPDERYSALIELAEPLDMLPLSSPMRVDLLCASAAIVSLTGAGPAAQRLVEAAEREHHEVGSTRTEALWLAARAIVSAVDGEDPENLREDAERSLLLAESAGDPVLLTIAYQAILRISYATGDLRRVDAVLEPMAAASERALLPFGVVRRHLCEVTNAIARGELDRVGELIQTARDVGERLRTHAVQGATGAQELLLEFELDVLEERGDILEMAAAMNPRTRAVTVAALARPHDDQAHRRLVSGIAHFPRDDTFSVAVALSTLPAAERRDEFLAQRCIDVLDPLGDRVLTSGFGSLVLGPARVYAGIAHLAAGDHGKATRCLERGVQMTKDSSAAMWNAHAQIWLAEAMIESDNIDAALVIVDSVVESGRFAETWRVRQHAALLVAAVTEGLSPATLRARRRRTRNQSVADSVAT